MVTLSVWLSVQGSELRQQQQKEALEKLRSVKRQLHQKLFAIRERALARRRSGGGSARETHASGVAHARVIAGALEAILGSASLELPACNTVSPAMEGVGATDTEHENSCLLSGGAAGARGAVERARAKQESLEAGKADPGVQRKGAALLAAKAQLNPTGLAVQNPQGLWTVAKKTSLSHTGLGTVKGLSHDTESSPLPAPSFSCLEEEEGA